MNEIRRNFVALSVEGLPGIQRGLLHPTVMDFKWVVNEVAQRVEIVHGNKIDGNGQDIGKNM